MQGAEADCLHPHPPEMDLHHDAAETAPPAAAHCHKHSGEESYPAQQKAAQTVLTHKACQHSTVGLSKLRNN